MKFLLTEKNKTYDYFDDGKINESRRMPVVITNIIPFNEIENETLYLWKCETEQCGWLYAKKTDYFIKGLLETNYYQEEQVVFVRTKNGGWFSLGFWGGRLDIDGRLAKLL